MNILLTRPRPPDLPPWDRRDEQVSAIIDERRETPRPFPRSLLFFFSPALLLRSLDRATFPPAAGSILPLSIPIARKRISLAGAATSAAKKTSSKSSPPTDFSFSSFLRSITPYLDTRHGARDAREHEGGKNDFSRRVEARAFSCLSAKRVRAEASFRSEAHASATSCLLQNRAAVAAATPAFFQ